MWTPRHRLSAAFVALSVVLVGCSGHATATSPTSGRPMAPVPTFSCTPETGGEPTPCTPEEYSYAERLKVVYAEAEDVFNEFFDENARLMREGGTEEATEVMRKTAGGPYLKAQEKHLKKMFDQGVRAVGGDITLVRIDRSPGAGAYGFEVALDVCIDSRTVELNRGKKVVGRGYSYAERVFFTRSGEDLKIWDSEGKKVSSC